MQMAVSEKLNRLYGLKAELFSTHKEEHNQIAEHKSRIIELERIISESSSNLQLEIQRLEGEIICETMHNAETQQGDYLQAIFTKAPTTFDSKRFKSEQPSLYQEFSKIGKPRVRITAVENGG